MATNYAFNFAVELGGTGTTAASFAQCLGLSTSTAVLEGRYGDDKFLNRAKVPGLMTYADITLTRGVTNDTQLWDWRFKVMQGEVEKRDISIHLRDLKQADVVTWNLFKAWPKEWVGPTFDGSKDEWAVEKLVIVYERFTVDKWGKKKAQWNLL